MAVFSRIVDVEMFSEVVLSTVREEEKRELQHRLGLLNVLNPVRVRIYVVPVRIYPPPHAARAERKKVENLSFLKKCWIYVYRPCRFETRRLYFYTYVETARLRTAAVGCIVTSKSVCLGRYILIVG